MEYLHTEDNKNEIHSVAYLNINQEAMIGTDSAKKAQNNPRPAWIPAQADRNKKKSFYVDQNRQHGVLVRTANGEQQAKFFFFFFSLQKTANSVESVAGTIRFTQCGNIREGGMESDRKCS